MRTAVATAINEPLTFTEREVPEPGPGEVLVKITACGVCYTDLDVLRGIWPIARFPVVPGHEITGVVALPVPAFLLLAHLGHISTKPGETVDVGSYTAEVTESTGRAITRVRPRPRPGRDAGRR